MKTMMNAPQPTPPPTMDILETAATWYVDLLDAAPHDGRHAAHQQWLAAHPAHRQAWDRLGKLQQALGKTPASIARPVLSSGGRSRRRAIKTLAGVLLLTGAGSVGWQRRDVVQSLVADLHTGVGDRLDHRLADGSLLQLNTDTALDIHYDDRLRQLILHRGELLVSTAVDAKQRPFIVHTRHGSIHAQGARFTVLSDQQHCRVGVLEHAVDVRAYDGHPLPISVQAGQQLSFNANAVKSAAALEPNSTAWVDGLLVASDWRLQRFAEQLSRYYPGRISCADEVAALRISGAFQIGDREAVLENLRTVLPVRIRHFSGYWIRFEAA